MDRTVKVMLTRRHMLCSLAAGIISRARGANAIPADDPDSDLLTDIERRTFNFYWERVNPRNGLMPDRLSSSSVCSITGTGFALTAWPIGVERGWISRNQARDITLRTLRFLEQLPQGERRSGTAGYRGFYYHRSEERRVGKECRSRWAWAQWNRKEK